MEIRTQAAINLQDYSQLPEEYFSFSRPEWNEPYIVESKGKQIDLNSGNVLNALYAKISYFNVNIENAEYAPVYLGSIQSFIQVAQNQNINLSGKEIDFFGDEWNFKDFRKRTQATTHFVYNLEKATEGLSDYYNVVLRLFLYYAISDRGVIHTSTYGTFNTIKNFVREIYKIRIYNLRNLNCSDIEKYIEQKNWSYNTQTKVKTAIKYFLTMYSFVVEDVFSKSINHYLSDINRAKLNALVEENKTPLLSTESFNKIELVLQKKLNDERLSNDIRLASGLILVCMQTGLRKSELVVLEKKSLTIDKMGDKTLGKLSYYSSKTHHKQENTITTIATAKSIDIIDRMISIDKENKSKYLAFNDSGEAFTTSRFDFLYRLIFLESCVEMGLLNNNNKDQFNSTTTVQKAMKRVSRKVNPPAGTRKDDLISVPTLRQFRVYFASDLRARGVDDRRISLMLGHSSKDMFGYYVRSAGEIQEEKLAIHQLIYEIADNKANLLGPKGSELESKIKRFMERNKYNVKENLEQIIDGVTNESELRIKLGGFCIHSNKRRTCHYDTSTDEFLCAYGCCPNHCHTYYSSPITYRKFKEIVVAIDYNLANNFIQQTEKEMKKLKVVILHELKPEIEDLQLQLTKQTSESIISRHPETAAIIENLEDIINEVDEWLTNIADIERKLKEC